jgi:hypothetical protein
MTELEKKLAEKNNTMPRIYGDLVNSYIREVYSLSEELSITRQKEEKPEEYAQMTAYIEQCKIRARQDLGLVK